MGGGDRLACCLEREMTVTDHTTAKKPPPKPPAWLLKTLMALHVFVYRASGGAIGGRFSGGAPVLLLSVRRRKSGTVQTIPLLYTPTDRGVAVIASFGGAEKHPAWYLNLTAAGQAEIDIRREHKRVRCEIVEPDSERYRSIWRAAAASYPAYDDYQSRTARKIPIVELTAT